MSDNPSNHPAPEVVRVVSSLAQRSQIISILQAGGFRVEFIDSAENSGMTNYRLVGQEEELDELREKAMRDFKSSLQIMNAPVNQLLEGWARALEMRDFETKGHSQRVCSLCTRLARTIGISGSELISIQRGALLHDVGKMSIPDSILIKPGALTAEEWYLMRLHPVYGYEMLAPISFLQDALDIPHYHHEKWNGTGYPAGMVGEEIPLAARIFALVDVWDALTSDRPFRKAWSKRRAANYVQEQANIHFDPEITPVFIKLLTDSGSQSDAGEEDEG